MPKGNELKTDYFPIKTNGSTSKWNGQVRQHLKVCVCKRTNTHFFHIGLCKRLSLIANAFYLNEVLAFFPLLTYSKQNKQTNNRKKNKKKQSATYIGTNRIKIAANQVYLPFRSAHATNKIRRNRKKRGGKVNRTMFTVHTYKSSPIFLLISSCVPNFVFFLFDAEIRSTSNKSYSSTWYFRIKTYFS